MLIIVAKNTLKSGCIDAFKEAAMPLIEASRAEEGNISYDLFEDINNPNVLTFIEKWENEAAIEIHNNSSHFLSIVPKLHVFAAQEGDVVIYRQTI